MGSEKNDHKKLAIRKKSTILGFLPSNFNTQLAMPVRFQEKKLVKIGCHLPPKIKVQTEMQLDGTSGMSSNIFISKFLYSLLTTIRNWTYIYLITYICCIYRLDSQCCPGGTVPMERHWGTLADLPPESFQDLLSRP